MLPIPLFGPVPGGMEMMVILLIAILLFGANKIPKLARSTGEAMGEFQKGRQEVEEELREATQTTDSERTAEVEETADLDETTDADETVELEDDSTGT